MVTGFSIQVIGMDNAKRFVKAKGMEALRRADEGVKESAMFLRAEVVESIAGHRAETKSVDTSRFKNSVVDDDIGKFKARVSSNVTYGKFLEYGTSRIPARSHFRNTAKRNEKKVVDFIRVEVDKI